MTDLAEISCGVAPGYRLPPLKISAPSDNVFFVLDEKRGGVSKTKNKGLAAGLTSAVAASETGGSLEAAAHRRIPVLANAPNTLGEPDAEVLPT